MIPSFRQIRAIAAGLARDQHHRRTTLFMLTLGALVMLFAGTFMLWDFFTTHPLLFAIYWLVCIWIVICVILLALYDLLHTIRRDRRNSPQD